MIQQGFAGCAFRLLSLCVGRCLSQADFFGKAGKISIKNLKNPVKKLIITHSNSVWQVIVQLLAAALPIHVLLLNTYVEKQMI